MSLSDRKFLFLDCQTTGMRPPSGHLLEIAWVWASAGEKELPEPRSFLLRLPEGGSIPPKVTEITGIEAADLETAVDPAEALAALREEASAPDCFALIHYAQFERAFLKHGYGNAGVPFPVLCSYQIARRLFPHLPSRNIRGLLGYCGETVGDIQRASSHVLATVRVWRHLARELERQEVHDLEGLGRWLAQKPKVKRGKYEYRMDKFKRLELPECPGIYRMLSRGGDVLYVGKATSLRSRVNSYFRGRKGRDRRKLEMLSRVWDIEVTECGSSLEAALLENEEIKRLDPPYNVQLKAGRRRLLFYSRDFSEAAFAQDEAHMLGPFREANGVETLRLWLEALESGEWEAIFYEPVPGEVAREGHAIFYARHGAGHGIRGLLAVGLRLLRERAKAGAGEEELEAEEAERPLTAEDMGGRFERMAERAAAGYRRAKALTRLLNSRVSWEKDGDWRRLEIRGGKLLTPESRVKSTSSSLPWSGLEITDYDRMSVLLTELGKGAYLFEILPR